MTAMDGLEEATKCVEANLSPRYLKLDRLERFVEGTQYDGLPDWFEECDVPLWNRKPCIVYPIVQTAVRSNVDLVLGESRFPTITSNPGEDDSDFSETGFNEEQSETFDRFLQEIERQAKFRKVAREALYAAQSCGSSATICGIRNGKLFLENVKAKWCEVEEDPETGAVTKLTIQYPYTVQEKIDGRWRVRAKLYRRVIDTETDTVFSPADARQDGIEPRWTIQNQVAHGFGFCPVIWYRFDRRSSIVGHQDGHAIHRHLLDEIQALDFVLSQRHRAVLFLGDPQLIEIGVEHGFNPGETGRSADILATAAGGAATDKYGSNPVTGRFVTPTTAKPVRRKSPGTVWQYESEKVKVDMLTLPAEALRAIDENAKDLRKKIAEALSVVLVDAEDLAHTRELSGKALEVVKQRQIDRCDVIRDDFGDGWILPAAYMLLKITKLKAAGLRLAGLSKVRPILNKLQDDPMLSLRWPSYYTPNAQDEQWIVALTAQAKDAGIITTRMAVQKLAGIFDIKNVDQAVDAVESERDEALQQLQQAGSDVSGDGSGSAPNGRDSVGPQVRGVPRPGSGRKQAGKQPSAGSADNLKKED